MPPCFALHSASHRTQSQHYMWATCQRRWWVCLLASEFLHFWTSSFLSESPIGIHKMKPEDATLSHTGLWLKPHHHVKKEKLKSKKYSPKFCLGFASREFTLTVSPWGCGSESACQWNLSHLEEGTRTLPYSLYAVMKWGQVGPTLTLDFSPLHPKAPSLPSLPITTPPFLTAAIMSSLKLWSLQV